jgi:hypothetical protein
MINVLDQIVLTEIEKDSNARNNLSTKVKSFLDIKSYLLKENPLQWERVQVKDIHNDLYISGCCLIDNFHLLSVCPFTKKVFKMICYYSGQELYVKLTVNNETLFEDSLHCPIPKNRQDNRQDSITITILKETFDEYKNRAMEVAEKLR